ncbi:hypothetical protein UA08_01381 [Talaromyces atroroseus]|uniref:Phosphotransferase n=1 Tax=Talaromyces atroroseus TaxID=1441469 RepID=A0A1Q5Q9Z0_TALAT|nr:hypothetical protein UA08_01381 [Talaromyces atroroseus]OKL62638.1 hypothetical protein UA08_01381 [Talaromyces atroroseus]
MWLQKQYAYVPVAPPRKTSSAGSQAERRELHEGLTVEDGDLVRGQLSVGNRPYITIDMGGTNKNRGTVWLAACLNSSTNAIKTREKFLPFAFTFSFPVTQPSIRSGILQRWTWDFDVDGVEDEDVVPQLERAFAKRSKFQHVPVSIVAVVKDTTGTLVASAYKEPNIKIGSIFSTREFGTYGTNAEHGAFDNAKEVLPRTWFDCSIDENSSRPGQQLYEKMVAGLYIGEVLHLVLLDLHGLNLMFKGQDGSLLRGKTTIDSLFLSTVEEDTSDRCMTFRSSSTKLSTLNRSPWIASDPLSD